MQKDSIKLRDTGWIFVLAISLGSEKEPFWKKSMQLENKTEAIEINLLFYLEKSMKKRNSFWNSSLKNKSSFLGIKLEILEIFLSNLN
jgi:hypothetical protein